MIDDTDDISALKKLRQRACASNFQIRGACVADASLFYLIAGTYWPIVDTMESSALGFAKITAHKWLGFLDIIPPRPCRCLRADFRFESAYYGLAGK